MPKASNSRPYPAAILVWVLMIVVVLASASCTFFQQGKKGPEHASDSKIIQVNSAVFLLGLLNEQYDGAGLTKPKKDFTDEDFLDIANHILVGSYKPDQYFTKPASGEKIALGRDKRPIKEGGVQVFHVGIIFALWSGPDEGGVVYDDPFYMVLSAHNTLKSSKYYMLPLANSYTDLQNVKRRIIEEVQTGKYDMTRHFLYSSYYGNELSGKPKFDIKQLLGIENFRDNKRGGIFLTAYDDRDRGVTAFWPKDMPPPSPDLKDWFGPRQNDK